MPAEIIPIEGEGFKTPLASHPQACEFLGSFSKTPRQRTLDRIALIAAKHRLNVDQIMSSDRRYRTSRARQEVMWTFRQDGWSFPKIGALVGRDHTTVMHGVRAHMLRQAV